MTDVSNRFALPLLAVAQAQKEITHNEAVARIDSLLHPSVVSDELAIPPTTPATGQAWLVAAGGADAWSGQDGNLAVWTSGGWRFFAPRAGLLLWDEVRSRYIFHDGGQWQTDFWPVSSLKIAGAEMLTLTQSAIADPAGGAVVDGESRVTLAAVLAVLRAHGLIATA